MTSFAAKGWQEENGSWYYYSNDDDYVTNDWKKSGNNWFWLGDDGAMVTDSLIEDGDYKYYVNANGAMVTNSWVAVEPGEDADDDAPDHYWYYFGSNGKAYKATSGLSIKTINGKKYGFNEDSRMVYGFVTEDGEENTDENPFVDAMYYFGDSDDGAMHTDWLQYMDGSDLTSSLTNKEYADMDEMWFYFKPSNGKMITAKESKGALKTQTVRGNKYAFDENGVMVYSWQNTSTPSATPSKYFSDQTDGHLKKKTWIWAVPDEDMNKEDYDNDDERWFYVDAAGEVTKNSIKKINGKKYLFDNDGIMKAGLQWVDAADSHVYAVTDDNTDTSDEIMKGMEDYTLYYFGDEETDGSMKTGKNIKIELDDDTFTFAFKNSGAAYDYRNDGLVSKKIYINGILQKADSDERYAEVKTPNGEGNMHKSYLVSTSGTIVGNGKYVKDGDDNWWAVTDEGLVVEVGSDDYDKDIAKCVSDSKKYYADRNKDGELRGYKCADTYDYSNGLAGGETEAPTAEK